MKYLAVGLALALGGCAVPLTRAPAAHSPRDYVILDAKGDWKNGVIFVPSIGGNHLPLIRTLYSQGRVSCVRLEHMIDIGHVVELKDVGVPCRGLEEKALYNRSLQFTSAQVLAMAYDQRRTPETLQDLERSLLDVGIDLRPDMFGKKWERTFTLIKSEAERVIIDQRANSFAVELHPKTAYVVDLLMARRLFEQYDGAAAIIAASNNAEWDWKVRLLYEHVQGRHR